jgi:hypothetical protein
LTDVRDNQLPAEITNPVVVIIPRNSVSCFVVGRPDSAGFRIACNPASDPLGSTLGQVDLLIMEME